MGAPGCDDAPVVILSLGPTPKPVTMIYPYYCNPMFLLQQITGWWTWPAWVREHVRLILVDDCSPSPCAALVTSHIAHYGEPFPIRVFRVEKDVRWNWLAARNIGAHHAPEGWLMMTDMDHVVPWETMCALVWGIHSPAIIYRFSRHERELGKPIHPHPNSWFMTREMFWKIGGYDERMSGYYGSDGYYRRRCAAMAPIRIMTAPLVRHEHVGDSSTTAYKRKQPEDAALRPLVRSFPSGSKPLILSFPYHEEFIHVANHLVEQASV